MATPLGPVAGKEIDERDGVIDDIHPRTRLQNITRDSYVADETLRFGLGDMGSEVEHANLAAAGDKSPHERAPEIAVSARDEAARAQQIGIEGIRVSRRHDGLVPSPIPA